MSKKILVVDDEGDINTALREVLELNGFTVDSYEDPFLALEKLPVSTILAAQFELINTYREISKGRYGIWRKPAFFE